VAVIQAYWCLTAMDIKEANSWKRDPEMPSSVAKTGIRSFLARVPQSGLFSSDFLGAPGLHLKSC
jgi:hypothetical protein